MHTHLHVVASGLLVGLFTLAGGCAATPKVDVSPSKTLAPVEAGVVKESRQLKVFRGGDGSVASWDSVVAAATGADAVVIGENHGHKLGLAFASELWADVLARKDHAVLSMEFFNRDEQARLDDYLQGVSDEDSFLRATHRVSDAAYPPGHRAMVELAKAHSRPVIASNAPRVYVTTASKKSYDKLASLTPEQRRLFRIPDQLPTGKYRTDYDAIMSDPAMAAHGGPAKEESPEDLHKRLDSGFRAQSLWDWTMAESVAHGIEHDGRPVVHVVGRFHSDFSGGLIQALQKLRPGVGVVTVSVVDATSESLRTEDQKRADFVVYVGKSE